MTTHVGATRHRRPGDTPTSAALEPQVDGPIDREVEADVETDLQLEGVVAAAIVARTLPEYGRAWLVRLRSGDTGLLPVILGLILISIIFQSLNSNFLTAGNIVNLLVQGVVYMLLAMAEVYVLLLGEIDLSAGFVGGVGGLVAAELRHSRSTAAGRGGSRAGPRCSCAR